MSFSCLQRPLAPATILALSLSTSGCFLQTISGAVFERANGDLITITRTDSLVATCVTAGVNVGCTYRLLDENGFTIEIFSSADLISEFGILGSVIDPLILQIPGDATNITGTYDDGSGTSGDLVIQSGFKSIPVDSSRTLFAERRQQFVIAELPDGVPIDGVPYTMSLSFERLAGTGAVDVKPMLALKFEAGSQVFHTPFLPCVTDMANIAPISIPQAATLQPITPPEIPQGCNGEQYFLAGFGVFPCDFDADDDVDRDDIALQASARNAPALPGDRLDANGNRWIDMNDVRRCARQCTRPRCAR